MVWLRKVAANLVKSGVVIQCQKQWNFGIELFKQLIYKHVCFFFQLNQQEQQGKDLVFIQSEYDIAYHSFRIWQSLIRVTEKEPASCDKVRLGHPETHYQLGVARVLGGGGTAKISRDSESHPDSEHFPSNDGVIYCTVQCYVQNYCSI